MTTRTLEQQYPPTMPTRDDPRDDRAHEKVIELEIEIVQCSAL